MSVRGTGIVVFGLGLAAFLGYLQIAAKGPFVSPAAGHLREMKERIAAPPRPIRITHANIAALPSGLRYPAYAALERRGVSIEGYVQKMFYSTDGDLHLEVTPTLRAPGARDTAYMTAEITLPVRHRHPGWTYEAFYDAFRPNLGRGPRWDAATRRVRLTGWLLYDFQYDGVTPTVEPLRVLWNRFGQERTYRPEGAASIWPRISGWEIHPVTGVEVWDESRGGFAEVGS